MKFLVGVGLALLFNWVLGWAWTVVAGIVLGFWVGRRGWFHGTLALAVASALPMVYTYLTAAESLKIVMKIMGDILGGAPPVMILVFTMLKSALLGAAGGLVGTGLRNLLLTRRR